MYFKFSLNLYPAVFCEVSARYSSMRFIHSLKWEMSTGQMCMRALPLTLLRTTELRGKTTENNKLVTWGNVSEWLQENDPWRDPKHKGPRMVSYSHWDERMKAWMSWGLPQLITKHQHLPIKAESITSSTSRLTLNERAAKIDRRWLSGLSNTAISSGSSWWFRLFRLKKERKGSIFTGKTN